MILSTVNTLVCSLRTKSWRGGRLRMKYIVILGDGMADEPLESLGGQTPLEAAKTPVMDALASGGELGLAKTVPASMKPGSDVANLAVLGYDPEKNYSGRSPLEALSVGVKMRDTDVVFRCNIVTVTEEEPYAEKTILDHSSGEISTEDADVLVNALREELQSEEFRFYTGTSTTCNSIYHHIVIQQEIFCQWQQAQLNTSSKTAWISHMLAMADGTTVQFRQTIHKVMVIALDTIVHAEVDNLQIFRHIVAIHKFLGIAMSCAEEQHIDFIQRKLVGKNQISFTIQAFVNVCNLITCVTTTIDKFYFDFRVINQQTNQFACCITCPTDNSYLNHNQMFSFSSLWFE